MGEFSRWDAEKWVWEIVMPLHKNLKSLLSIQMTHVRGFFLFKRQICALKKLVSSAGTLLLCQRWTGYQPGWSGIRAFHCF